ncbi:acetolactate decarboxylase [Rhodopirellula sp. SWK7]|uniref:acetolactate decarboxylase n=1 Tax=Rhodopirellula sp. SWK7 TaxID=595460 RepID=UPI0002BDE2AF|nr:acetolactate decarboxylase [Rhodopirellula sp. SWK7]EMI41513.1 alpha-acetolactate decarboxylase [Rhodopirellula sp. SWK7]
MQRVVSHLFVSCFSVAFFATMVTPVSAEHPGDGSIIQFGKMHEAIGMHQDHGRVVLSDLVKRPHFYGVAALEELEGEVTIDDGKITITGVDRNGEMKPITSQGSEQATMLVGAYVPTWVRHKVTSKVDPDQFDRFVAETASSMGIDITNPFLFRVEGEFTDVRLHVIHGACPIHARMTKVELPQDKKAFECDLPSIRGTLIGVYAKDAVGSLTHPATSTHVHILYEDPDTGAKVTAHVERIGLVEGSILMLSK